MPARLGALGDDDVHTGGGLALRVDDRADETGDLHAALVRLADEILGCGPERVRDELHLRVRPDHLQQRVAARVGEPHQLVTGAAGCVLAGVRLHAVALEQRVEERAVLLGDEVARPASR